MKRGGKLIGTAAMLSIAACGGEQGKLQIRTSATPLAAGNQAVPFRIAEARGQLALGNVALALEAFRLALREDPSSIDAMLGVAACYDSMTRFDLSRRHYESALANAPGDPQLLAAFAASLDLQGRKTEAASVRAEINQRLAMAARKSLPPPAPAPVVRLDTAEVAVTPPPGVATRLIAAPPSQRNVSTQRAPVLLPVRDAAAKPVRGAEPAPAPTASPRATVRVATARSVTVALPPARPITQTVPATAPVAIVAAPPPAPTRPVMPPAKVAVQSAALPSLDRPVATPPREKTPAVESAIRNVFPPAAPVAALAATRVTESLGEIARAERDTVSVPVEKTDPRLERTSLREVALITTAAPKWRALTVKRTQRSATVRFVPLRQASVNLSGIRLLNAARVDRLAARTRSYLLGRGWSSMAIGDAPAVRARSVIFYPPERRRTAQTLSAQFGFVMAPRPGSRQITVLLGRDAARVSALRASG